MPEMHLRQPRFICSAYGPFNKNKERILKFKETGDSRYIYQNQLDKAWFQHDRASWDFKDLLRRTTSDKILRNKAFHIAKNPKYYGYQRGLASMVYNFFDKKLPGTSAKLKKYELCQTKYYLKNCINQLLENLIHKKYTHLL